MPSLDPAKLWFRREVWSLIEDCATCENDPCMEWCREFVSCQMDGLVDRLVAMLRQRDPGSPA